MHSRLRPEPAALFSSLLSYSTTLPSLYHPTTAALQSIQAGRPSALQWWARLHLCPSDGVRLFCLQPAATASRRWSWSRSLCSELLCYAVSRCWCLSLTHSSFDRRWLRQSGLIRLESWCSDRRSISVLVDKVEPRSTGRSRRFCAGSNRPSLQTTLWICRPTHVGHSYKVDGYIKLSYGEYIEIYST